MINKTLLVRIKPEYRELHEKNPAFAGRTHVPMIVIMEVDKDHYQVNRRAENILKEHVYPLEFKKDDEVFVANLRTDHVYSFNKVNNSFEMAGDSSEDCFFVELKNAIGEYGKTIPIECVFHSEEEANNFLNVYRERAKRPLLQDNKWIKELLETWKNSDKYNKITYNRMREIAEEKLNIKL